MQAILDHIDTVIRPALRNYSAAEATFTAAQNDGAGVDEALNRVMLTARQAANELHHLADFVLNNPPPRSSFADLGAVRATVHSHLIFLREPAAPPVDDVALCDRLAENDRVITGDLQKIDPVHQSLPSRSNPRLRPVCFPRSIRGSFRICW
jgi:hypothetical protein